MPITNSIIADFAGGIIFIHEDRTGFDASRFWCDTIKSFFFFSLYRIVLCGKNRPYRRSHARTPWIVVCAQIGIAKTLFRLRDTEAVSDVSLDFYPTVRDQNGFIVVWKHRAARSYTQRKSVVTKRELCESVSVLLYWLYSPLFHSRMNCVHARTLAHLHAQNS